MIMVCQNSALTTGCINPDGGAVGIEPTGTGQDNGSYTATLASSGNWYWEVRGAAYLDSNWGNYSPVWTFTTP
jgi:hypothetical protein